MKTVACFFLSFVLSVLPTFSQEQTQPSAEDKDSGRGAGTAPKGEPPLFVVRVDGKEGFINPKGKIAILPTFQSAYPFQGGLAPVQVDGLWGFIDAKGTMVIKPRFTQVGFFSEGLARFRSPYRQLWSAWGYINREGEVVIEPRCDSAGDFRGGVARLGFTTTRGKLLAFVADAQLVPPEYRFIDRTGVYVEDPGPTRFATGRPGELILFKEGEKYGYVGADGKVVIKSQFAAASSFSEGLACVRKEALCGYIDKSGKFVIPPRFPYPNDFSEGLAGVPLGGKGWGFIDRTGKVVIPATRQRYVWSRWRGTDPEVVIRSTHADSGRSCARSGPVASQLGLQAGELRLLLGQLAFKPADLVAEGHELVEDVTGLLRCPGSDHGGSLVNHGRGLCLHVETGFSRRDDLAESKLLTREHFGCRVLRPLRRWKPDRCLSKPPGPGRG